MSRKLMKGMRTVAAAVLAYAVTCGLAASASASGPQLKLRMLTPDSVTAGHTMTLRIWVQNVGDQATSGQINVVDAFSAPVASVESNFFTGEISSSANFPTEPTNCESKGGTLSCATASSLPPGAQLLIAVEATIPSETIGIVSDAVSVSGGGMVGNVEEDRTISIGPPGLFGFTEAAVELLNADGSADVQAGSSPSEYTTKLNWRSFYSEQTFIKKSIGSVENPKDVIAHLPPGFIGNPSVSALCTTNELSTYVEGTQSVPACPADSQIGVARVGLGNTYLTTGLFNMVAPYGVATELGFNVFGTLVLLDAHVRPGDHGIDIVSSDTSTSVSIGAVEIVVWGVPADASHDVYRGTCLEGSFKYGGSSGLRCPTIRQPQAFLRTPTSCPGSPLAFGAETNSYQHEDVWSKADFTGSRMSGCEALPFSPDIHVEPTGTATNSPTGVSVKLSLPQTTSPDGLAEADLKKAVVTLPEGMAINPSAADGLVACEDAHLHLDSNQPAECPDGSKIGTVVLHTQLIPNPIEGWIYIRPQNSSDPASGEMFRMAIELRDDAHGLDFKIAGQIAANPRTGRLTTTFDENPQFPFEDISLRFKSGARAPLATPPSCATQTTEASLYSWARPEQATHRSSSFQLTSGPNGSPCPGAVLPFGPSLNAGVGSVEAGAFTPFLVTFSRSDVDQNMQRVSVTMPKGLLGSLVGLPLCPEPQASAGTCPAGSQIGTVTAGAGAGPTPFYVMGGKVYMTGPYEGAPFGLSVVVPTKAGPFDLGTVVVRSRVEIDPYTSQLTVTTDPLPQVVGGVPVDLRLVNVTINRPNFVFNPTDCAHTSITGKMTGVQGSTAALSNPFQVTNCASLGFKPKFSASTSAKASRENGASLHVLLAYPKNAFGTQTNVKSVHVELPKALPSRLSTLNHACPDSVFNRNPANCPAGSRVGFAKSTTPILPVPLEGPAYFVSHGGQKFPELIVVLQGYGVAIYLGGETFISKAGITSSTFNSVPDVPVESFELTLPEGPFSALAANRNLCSTKLVMPTAFTGQDGAVLKQATRIVVSGCKSAIRVLSRRTKGSRAWIRVKVPSAGKLIASGSGIQRAVKNIGNARVVTIEVGLSPSYLRAASMRRLAVRVKAMLRFEPRHGKALYAQTMLLLR